MGDLSCADCVDRFGDYVDGVLPPDHRSALEEHLRKCRACDQLLVEYRRAPEIARRATDVPMPPLAGARLRRLLSRMWRRPR
jgi:anti-sigma factor RsiW